jgi:hypothetical protein
MTERVIEVAGVEKAYRFFHRANVSLELEAGQIMDSSARTGPASRR